MPRTMGFGKDYDLIPAFAPLDLQTARAGDFVSLKNTKKLTVVVFKGVGTAGDDPLLTFEQAKAVGGTPKDLAKITQYWMKQAVTDLTGTGTWTRVTQTAGATVQLDAVSAESAGMYVFHIDPSDLDVANQYDCVGVKIADTGTNAQLGCIFYILENLYHAAAPQSLINSIVD